MKILIVKLHALGDLVIASPAIRRLREGLPDAKIDLLTTNWAAPAVQGNLCINDLIIVDNGLFFSPAARTIIPTLRLIWRLSARQYDTAVLFHKHRMVDLFSAMTGINRRYRFGDENNTYRVRLDQRRHSALTAWELADFVVRDLGGGEVEYPDLIDLRYEWNVSEDEAQQAQQLVKDANLEDNSFITVFPGGGINPNSQDNVKRWGVDKFALLLDHFGHEFNIPVVLMGGSSDREVSEQVAARTRIDTVNFTGRLNIRISAAFVKRSLLAVANDSGPLHITAAVGVPVVGIFGPTGSRIKLPPGDSSFAAESGMACSPCYFGSFKRCIFDRVRCMEDLSVDSVMAVIRNALVLSGIRKVAIN